MWVSIMGNNQFAINGIREAILLHAWVEIDFDVLTSVLLQGEFLAWAAERLVDLKIDRGGKGTHIADLELFSNGTCWNSLLPQVLELELWVVELQNWRNEITKHKWVEHVLGLAVISNHNLALPWL